MLKKLCSNIDLAMFKHRRKVCEAVILLVRDYAYN